MPPLLDRYLNETIKNTPLVFYRMREGTGTTMLDFSANANNGTYNGSGVSWVNTAGNYLNGYARSNGRDAPLFNSHYNAVDFTQTPAVTTLSFNAFFDGAAGRATATLGTINTGAASKVTIEMWVKWDGVLAGSNGTFEALANFGGATGLLLGFLKNGASDYRFGLSVRNTGDLWGLNNATTLSTLTKDTYHHIVYVIVNNAVQTSKLYIDGVQYTMSQQIGTSTTTKSVTSALALGYDGTASFFGGSMGEVAVFNGEPFGTALSTRNRFSLGAYGGEWNETPTIPGIEGQVELYGDQANNTMLINDKNNTAPGNRTRVLDQYYLSEIGGLDDADIRFSEESNFYRDGVNPLVTRHSGRTLTFDGYIEASNFQSLRQLQTKLKRSVDGFNSQASGITEYPLILRNVWDNGFDFMANVRKSVPLQIKEAQSNYAAKRSFLITLRSSYPFFESVGTRVEVMQMGATLAIPHKGNAISLPQINVWGPFTSAQLVLNNTLLLSGTVLASSFVAIDCKNRTCSDWTKFSTTGDFPYINPAVQSDTFRDFAQFVSVTGGTAGVTKVEISWKHTMI